MVRVAMDGSYTVERLAPGEYTVMASLPGYLSPMDDIVAAAMAMPDDRSPAALRQLLASNGSVTISGGETESYDISLQRGASVSGHILYSDGAPATQILIEVQDANAKKLPGDKQRQAEMAAGFSRVMFTHQSQNTDDQGHFRIAGLKPGTYRVAAISSVAANLDSESGDMPGIELLIGGMADPSALRVYSGDTLHAKAAKTYELRAGDDVTGVDITIPLNAFHQVKGVLTAVDGRPINQATLTLTDSTDDSVTFESQVADDGSFSFPTIANGTYTLAASNATIITRLTNADANVPLRFVPTKPTNAFADGKTSVIVKDSDLSDVSLTLTEVPLPPQPTPPAQPNNVQPIPDDPPDQQP